MPGEERPPMQTIRYDLTIGEVLMIELAVWGIMLALTGLVLGLLWLSNFL